MAVTIKFDEKEEKRLQLMMTYENQLYAEGVELIAGIDEVGRGPLAGPVVTAAVILPKNLLIPGVNDSKKLSEKKRVFLFDEIKRQAIAIGIGIVDEDTIDRINILNATKLAMRQAVEDLSIKAEYLLLDAVKLDNMSIKQMSLIKGDMLSQSIAAASIIAKVTRDAMMVEWDKTYPAYGFARNKGYGTREHVEAIKEKGLCPLHRRSFTKNFTGA